ncbi:MAG: phosphoribosylamine--glycine ligase [Spirochaetes bacterium]|nr:phosphoribosylamine--glycine ligase [Spirochaetota bacterium]
MRYLVVGSGGREHAIAWRLLHDGSASEVYVAPGNGGIDDRYRINIAVNDFESLYAVCRQKNIDVVVIGPEAPLVDGVVDFLQNKGITVFGPTAKAAQLEGSKLFAKYIMQKYNVPTAHYREFKGKGSLINYIASLQQFPVVIKLDGLAAGKGVGVCKDRESALQFISDMVKDDTRVFVEDFCDGEEASVLGISDGTTVLPFIAAQDHKRVFDNDEGPNTGGMGAYAPAPVVTSRILERVHREILTPVIQGMKNEGMPFVGILYAGLIINNNTINVLEFNVRFGDPEAQVLLPLINGKLGDYILAAVEGKLSTMNLSFRNKHAITVVLASGGYPGSYKTGFPIKGLDQVPDDILVFHAGTKRNGQVVTNGGRVLNITAVADTLEDAYKKVYNAIPSISFEGMHYRRDIGFRALKKRS